MEKVLSVVVPTYNMESLLTRCLDSFLLEDSLMDLLEVIVVNDGSKDGSLGIAKSYASRYPHTFKVIDQQNGNYGSCINAALKVATGKYFRICDADDRYENCNLSRYVRFLQLSDSDIVLSPYCILQADGTVDKQYSCADNLLGKVFKIDELCWDSKDLVNFRPMHCMATRTELFLKNNYVQSEGISYTDSQFVFYSHLYSETCCFFSETIYCYYLGRDGQTMSKESMLKSHHHFYVNASKMVDDYVALQTPVSEHKRRLLVMTINSLLIFYVRLLFAKIPNAQKQIDDLNDLLNKAKTSIVPCELEEDLLKIKSFYFWRKWGVSAQAIYRFKNLFK